MRLFFLSVPVLFIKRTFICPIEKNFVGFVIQLIDNLSDVRLLIINVQHGIEVILDGTMSQD